MTFCDWWLIEMRTCSQMAIVGIESFLIFLSFDSINSIGTGIVLANNYVFLMTRFTVHLHVICIHQRHTVNEINESFKAEWIQRLSECSWSGQCCNRGPWSRSSSCCRHRNGHERSHDNRPDTRCWRRMERCPPSGKKRTLKINFYVNSLTSWFFGNKISFVLL